MSITLLLETRLEKLCAVSRFHMIKYQEYNWERFLPVVEERAAIKESSPSIDAEIIRLRAFNDKGLFPCDFHSFESALSVVICHRTKEVHFGPTGHIIMRQRGVGLGSTLLATLIKRLVDKGLQEYAIDPGSLSDVDARTEEARISRNSFYMSFGFTLTSLSGETGLDVVSGKFSAPSVGSLTATQERLERLMPWKDFDRELFRCQEQSKRDQKAISEARQWFGQLSGTRRRIARWLGCPL
ncbi:hypothetical protein I5I84_00540 [Pseudomonas aeruginosa]|nr:hypothetical protein [Pseudomonas aeruginosa]